MDHSRYINQHSNYFNLSKYNTMKIQQLLTMDDSTLVTRKDAANRDKQYDLRTLVNHQISERICTSGFGLKYAWFGII